MRERERERERKGETFFLVGPIFPPFSFVPTTEMRTMMSSRKSVVVVVALAVVAAVLFVGKADAGVLEDYDGEIFGCSM